MKKVKKQEYNKAKERSKSLAMAVNEEIKSVDVLDVINGAYIETSNDVEYWLVKEIDIQLVKAKTNFNLFKQEIHNFFKKTAQQIKRENKSREFFDFYYKTHLTLEKRTLVDWKNVKVATAYYDILVELGKHMASEDYFVLGLTTDNKILQKRELYPNTDVYFAEAMAKIMQKPHLSYVEKEKILINTFKSRGYNISGFDEIQYLMVHEKAVINMHFITAFLVDEDYLEFCPNDYIPSKLNAIKFQMPHRDTDKYRPMLKARKRLLPRNGVSIHGFTTGNVQEVYLREKFHNDNLYLMYRIKADNKYQIGFYDVIEEFFTSHFLDDKKEASLMLHKLLENFILELYAVLTAGADVPWEFRFSIDEKSDSATSGEKSYSKSDYDRKIKSFDISTRKLPMGANASADAIQKALKYGIQLDNGYTFVSGFDRAVRVKKDNKEGDQ